METTQEAARAQIARGYIKASKHPAYALIFGAARELGIIGSFHADLTLHDHAALEDAARGAYRRTVRTAFAWYVYPNGTHLAWMDGTREGFNHAATLVRSIAESFKGGRWFLWDGAGLHSMADHREILANIERWRFAEGDAELAEGLARYSR